MNRLEEVYQEVKRLEKENVKGVTASEISKRLQIDRSTSSRYLNELVKQNRIIKIKAKPVRFKTNPKSNFLETNQLNLLVGRSLVPILEKALAAIMYPGKPLPILITGETGTGKTYLAETISKLINERSENGMTRPFISFNCADYAHNPELLVGQIFGVKKGAYTGADTDKVGLVERANNGILFLDEIHRLTPSGQEMLFNLIDKGIYRRLGESSQERRANVALIGATTEDPKTALLPTLYRRFTVKLQIPPLRERSKEERAELLEQLLAEEATKMNTNLSIVDQCKDIFLSYEYPGNIGLLKNEIQIACPRAYLRYLNHETEHVIIQEDDLSKELRNYYKNKMMKKEKIGVETDLANFDHDLPAEQFPNIYERLKQIKMSDPDPTNTERIQELIQDYVEELSQKYMHSQPGVENSWRQLIDHDLLHALERAYEHLRESSPVYINKNQIYVLGLHLQNYRNFEGNKEDTLPTIIHPNIQYRQVSRYIANILDQTIGLKLPEREIEIMPFFLAPGHYIQMISTQSIAVILVTHGDSTATSMADVANTLLGQNVIRAIDMPLDVSVQDTYERVKNEIKQVGNVNGVLLLVDMGSLIMMGDKLKHEVEFPIRTLSSVNLPMVIEAGRLSLKSDVTLDEIYEKTKNAMFAFSNYDTAIKTKKRMIATVCFTGEGAAQLLEIWLKDQLSEIDRDVVVRSVRIDPITKDTSFLNDLKNYYDVIAIIGTVPVSIEGVPYIPVWELLKTEGINRLEKLLELTRPSSSIAIYNEIDKSEIPQLISKGLSEIVKYVNPKVIVNILKEYIEPISHYFNWDVTKELGMWMHIGGLIERIVAAKMNQNLDTLLESIPFHSNLNVKKDEKIIWEPLIKKIEKEFNVTIPNQIVDELIKLSR